MNRKLHLLSLVVCVVFPLQAAAYDFMVDGLAYKINTDGNTVSVVPVQQKIKVPNDWSLYVDPNMPSPDSVELSASYASLDEIIVPDEVVSPSTGMKYAVTELAKGAFDGYYYIAGDAYQVKHWRSIELGRNMQLINDYAITGCDFLIINSDLFVSSKGFDNQATSYINYSSDGRSYIQNLIITDGVTSVEGYGMHGSDAGTGLERIVSFCKTPPRGSGFLTSWSPEVDLYVPYGSMTVYQADDEWGNGLYIPFGFSGQYPQSITLDVSNIIIKKGESAGIKVGILPSADLLGLTCAKSTDNSIASAFYYGNSGTIGIVGCEVGECVVFAYFGTVKSPVCHVTVVEADKDVVSLDKTCLTMEAGERKILNVSGLPASSMVTATSSNTNVVTVVVSGQRVMVTAVANGKATITVADAEGKAIPATCEVTVGAGDDQPVGDVTGDGRVDIADVNLCINTMLGKADQTAAADVSGDGAVDIADVNAIINMMLGK